MAEQQASARDSGSLIGGAVHLGVKVFVGAAMLVAKAWNALTADGTLGAAFRQGADEMASALKAFPDAIQAQETGTILNPTQGEVAAARKGHETGLMARHSFYSTPAVASPPHPWPSEIASQNRHQAAGDLSKGNELSKGHEHDAGHSM